MSARLSALAVAAALLLCGCFFERVNQRLAESPDARPWAGRVDVLNTRVSWDADAVGAGIGTLFSRVGPDRWRGAGREYTVEGRFVRGNDAVAELIDTPEGWRVRVSGGTSAGVRTWEFVRNREPEPAPQGLVRIARYERRSQMEPEGGVFVRADAADAGLPWPQLGLALLVTAPAPGTQFVVEPVRGPHDRDFQGLYGDPRPYRTPNPPTQSPRTTASK